LGTQFSCCERFTLTSCSDEILWHARIHPEQYCNTLTSSQVDTLFDKIMYVCDFACKVLGDKDQFPENCTYHHLLGAMADVKGLFMHRKAGKVPSGEKIVLLKVGGRTSAVVPSLQKKTGEGTSDIKMETVETGANEKPKIKGKAKAKEKVEKAPSSKKRKTTEPEEVKTVKKEEADEKKPTMTKANATVEKAPSSKKRKAEEPKKAKTAKKGKEEKKPVKAKAESSNGRRKSTRT
jgi:formamidopyrimidine-DNA glycosylase